MTNTTYSFGKEETTAKAPERSPANLGLRRLLHISNALGVNPLRSVVALRNVPRFLKTAIQYQHAGPPSAFRISIRDLFPQLADFTSQAGTARGHYFHQDLWASRKIYARRPSRHLDIGSRIDGFVAHLLTFMDVQVVDVLPLSSPVEGLTFVQGDATNLSDWPAESVESLSILHAAEHFGLGRYSDRVDPFAHERLAAELKRILGAGGSLYYSVPIGRERLMFNAHRIFSVFTVLKQFDGLQLKSFSYVDDEGLFHKDALCSDSDALSSLHYGCGLFEFYKG